jgi:glutamine amidotransferase
MCRWFAYLSPDEECLLEDVLITPDHSLAKQVHDHYLPKLFSHVPGQHTTKLEISLRNRLFNIDGFGVAWYTPVRSSFVNSTTGLRPALFKTSSPPMNDANFHSICANTSTTAVFAHIRAATGSTSVASINNHPFTFGRHTVMHNGIISSFSDIRRPLLELLSKDAYENVHGTTDSEHLAALYITYLTKSGGSDSWERQYPVDEMRDALIAAYQKIVELQQQALGAENVQANSLNVCCTDGAQMVAVRLRNHAVEQPPSLYWSTKAGTTLNRKYPDLPSGGANPDASKNTSEHGKHVIVASEPTTHRVEDWSLIEKNHALLVDAKGNCVVEEIEPPAQLLALAATGNHF